MLCLACEEEFNEPRFLKDLFRTKKYYICSKCLKKYPIEIEYLKFPLSNNHYLEIVSLFKSKLFNYNCYVYEYSLIYQKLIQTLSNSLVLPYERYSLNEEKLSEIEHISTLLNKDIIVLTNVFFD